MEEYEFRGKDSNGIWHYGDLIWNNGDCIIVEKSKRSSISSTGGHWSIEAPAYKVNLKTVGQFLCKIGNQEVYVGDINNDGDVLCFGEYLEEDINESQRLNPVFDKKYGFYWKGKYGDCYGFIVDTTVKIIGNIHDNPELLDL